MNESLRPKLLKTDVAHYQQVEWSGRYTGGIAAFGDNVVIQPDLSAEFAGEKGVILMTDTAKDNMTLASESGVLVHKGEDAFKRSPSTGQPYAGRVPQVGDRILFSRYSGRGFMGADGVRYLLMTDSCVGGIEMSPEETV